MSYLHNLTERYTAAHNFIAKWARHQASCEAMDERSACSCGFNEAVRELNHYCTEQMPAPPLPKSKDQRTP